MEKIKIEEENILPFYDEFGSKHFQLQSKILERFVGLQLDIYFKSVGFVSGVLGILGVIAGFGFTAFAFIQSKPLFFFGEALLIYAILKGIKWIQNIFSNEYSALVKEIEKHSNFFEERNELFMIVYNQLNLESHEIEKNDFQNLMSKDKESLTLFKPDNKNYKPQDIYSKEVYWSLTAGTVLLLLSFFCRDILNII